MRVPFKRVHATAARLHPKFKCGFVRAEVASVSSVSFVDKDLDSDELGGTVNWTPAGSTGRIAAHLVYLATSSVVRTPQTHPRTLSSHPLQDGVQPITIIMIITTITYYSHYNYYYYYGMRPSDLVPPRGAWRG